MIQGNSLAVYPKPRAKTMSESLQCEPTSTSFEEADIDKTIENGVLVGHLGCITEEFNVLRRF